jgi:hypothetical protein
MKIKAIINFDAYGTTELKPVAQRIHGQMTEHAADFPEPSVTMSELDELITDYSEKMTARSSRATADILAFQEARDFLKQALGRLGHYVNSIAKGSAMIVEKSGFPSYSTAKTPDTAPPAAPENLRLSHGRLSGTFLLRYKPDRKQSTNEVQICLSDPNREEDWQPQGIFRGGRAELGGFTPGIVVWVRVRTVGLKGVMGSWSDPAQIRIL